MNDARNQHPSASGKPARSCNWLIEKYLSIIFTTLFPQHGTSNFTSFIHETLPRKPGFKEFFLSLEQPKNGDFRRIETNFLWFSYFRE